MQSVNNHFRRIIITDLDGTLLKSDKTVSDIDLDTLGRLNKSGVLAVIATGRSLFSAKKVLDSNFPVNYLIFSSGVGIMDWQTKEIIKVESLLISEVEEVYKYLNSLNVDFTIQRKIPCNHECLFIRKSRENPDFLRRIDIYKEFCREYSIKRDDFDEACQFLVIAPAHNGLRIFNQIKKKLNDLKIIRTTSPLDGKSIWIEIFPANVSKANASNWLVNKLNIGQENSFAIGNDYNDLDLLNWANNSYVVENAPFELRKSFKITTSCNHNGFSNAILNWNLLD